MSRFGELLRFYRTRCRDAERGRALSQDRLGELIGRRLNDSGYTGGAVSEWERGRSAIPHDQRAVLVGLVKVLYDNGGLQNTSEADAFLQSGDYRPLDAQEKLSISPQWMVEGTAEHLGQALRSNPGDQWQMIFMWLTRLVVWPGEVLQELKAEGADGRLPDWPGALLAVMGRLTRRWSSAQVLQAILWVMVWCLGWSLTFPVLHWPFANPHEAWLATLAYLGGALVVPAGIGALTRTAEDEFWQRQNLARALTLRVFTYQGAYAGFQVGYMMIFAGALAGYYLGLSPLPRWLEGLCATWPVVLSYAAARQVPFNLWRAYGALRFTRADAIPTFAFVFFGPMWAWSFLTYSSWLLFPPAGITLILGALGLIAAATAWQERKNAVHPNSSGRGEH